MSPATVHTPSFPRDFRVDWVLQDDALTSTLAVEAAPVWLFAFQEVNAASYRSLSPIARTLSTLDVSVATTQEDRQRALSVAATMTLYRASDPVADTSYTRRLSRALRFTDAQTRAQDTIDAVVAAVYRHDDLTDAQRSAVDALADRATQFGPFDPETVPSYQSLSHSDKAILDPYVRRLRRSHETLTTVSDATASRLRALRQQYERAHWNDPRVDVAGGRVYRFDRTAVAAAPDSLALAGTGWGAWINAAAGLGTDNWLVSGLGRVVDRTQATAYFVGANLRYGSNDVNVFLEGSHAWGDRSSLTRLAGGGSFSLTNRFNVQFGLQTSFDANGVLREFAPSIKLNGRTAALLSGGPLF